MSVCNSTSDKSFDHLAASSDRYGETNSRASEMKTSEKRNLIKIIMKKILLCINLIMNEF